MEAELLGLEAFVVDDTGFAKKAWTTVPFEAFFAETEANVPLNFPSTKT